MFTVYRILSDVSVVLAKKDLFIHDFCFATVILAFHHYTKRPTMCFKGGISLLNITFQGFDTLSMFRMR